MGHHRIALLPGDGIGPEVVGAAAQVLLALSEHVAGLDLAFVEVPIGMAALEQCGDPLPPATVEAVKAADGALHGATDAAATPPEFPSPLRALRRHLDAYATVRPSVSLPGVAALQPGVDLVVVRETTEGMYSDIEYRVGDAAACSVRLVSRIGARRVARVAFDLAATRRGQVTTVHKRGGLPVGDGFWLDAVRAEALEHPEVALQQENVDAAAYKLVLHPRSFDVIVAENQYGDILSDVAAAVTGGLGLAASGTFGDRWAYFEPVHGTAPDIAGQGTANPIAAILAARMLLDHLGEREAAARIGRAVRVVLSGAEAATPDLGGTSTTADVTAAVVTRLA